MTQRRAHGRGAAAVTAVGKRSLSGYLAHSLLFAPLLATWGLGLGAHLGSATMALFATGVWLLTVAAAHTLERAEPRPRRSGAATADARVRRRPRTLSSQNLDVTHFSPENRRVWSAKWTERGFEDGSTTAGCGASSTGRRPSRRAPPTSLAEGAVERTDWCVHCGRVT